MNDRLYRSVDDRVIAGVCGGLAARLALDPSLVRILWVVVALVTGFFPLLVLYVIMAAVVPEEPGGFAGVGPSPTPPDTWANMGEATPAGEQTLVGDATLAGDDTLAGVAPEAGPPAPAPPTWYQGSPGGDPGRRTRRAHDPLPAMIGGLVLVAVGAYFLVRDWITVDWGIVGAAALVALGVVVIVAALRPRR
jgi:phage shock protein C